MFWFQVAQYNNSMRNADLLDDSFLELNAIPENSKYIYWWGVITVPDYADLNWNSSKILFEHLLYGHTYSTFTAKACFEPTHRSTNTTWQAVVHWNIPISPLTCSARLINNSRATVPLRISPSKGLKLYVMCCVILFETIFTNIIYIYYCYKRFYFDVDAAYLNRDYHIDFKADLLLNYNYLITILFGITYLHYILSDNCVFFI